MLGPKRDQREINRRLLRLERDDSEGSDARAYLKQKQRSSVVVEFRYDTTRTSRDATLREQFIELIKKARRASPTEKLQIEVALSLVIDELLMGASCDVP